MVSKEEGEPVPKYKGRVVCVPEKHLEAQKTTLNSPTGFRPWFKE